VFFFYVGGTLTSASSTAPPTTAPPTTEGPGVVITIDGGPNATAHIPGPQSDPADFYGILIVGLAIAAALIATRWLFGRRPGPGSK
jgi:hypothetical protein